MFCGNCGNELREGAKFCPKCGAMTRLGRQQGQPPAEPEQTASPVMPGPEPVPDTPCQQVRQQRPAAGKTRQTVRLTAVPVEPAQDTQPAPQAEQNSTSSPPPLLEPVARVEQQDTQRAQGTNEREHTDSEPPPSAENANAQSSGANSTKRKGNRGNIWLIVGAILASLIIGTLWGIISDGSKGGIKNKTEDIFISPGLTLVGDPTWEVDLSSITIKGKVKAETWIGTPVQVQVTFYDKDGAIVTTRHDYISDMQAGDIWRFEISPYRDEDISYFIIDGVYY